MTVMVLERVPTSVRGDLTRWMLEVQAGVFVGRLSKDVRDRLWERACQGMRGGAGLLAAHAGSEQGFIIRFWGRTSRRVESYEGLQLIRRPK